ncbi:MAG: hypothetical protein M3N21_05925 [Actinomycetota bacterium]|nr:hypothetical protein [Actinomycetota bacterium]
MKIRLLAATAILGSLGAFAAVAGPASAASVCVHATVSVSTVSQSVDKCVP